MSEEPVTPENDQTPRENELSEEPQVQATEPELSSNSPSNTADPSPRPWLQDSSAKSKKGPILGLIVLLAVIIVGVGGWAAYALWYQNPDKVIMDALASALTARTASASGTISTKTTDSEITATIDSKFGYKEGATANAQGSIKLADGVVVKVGGDGVYMPNGDGYLKPTNLQDAAKTYYDSIIKSVFGDTSHLPASVESQLTAGYNSQIAPLINQVDGKWVKITANDIKQFSSDDGNNYECYQKVLDNLQNNNNDLIELGKVYQKDKFIVVKQNLGVSNGSIGYVVDIDKNISKRFSDDVKSIKLYKDLKACSSNKPGAPDTDKTSKSERTELWIDQWSHKITRIKSATTNSDKSTANFDLKTQFDVPVNVTAPKQDLTLKDVVGDIQNVFGKQTSAPSGAGAVDVFGGGGKA